MTVKTSTSFDLEAFRRGYEEWDIEALLALYAGTEVVEFSPTQELGRTIEVVTKNMEEMQGGSS